MPDAATPDCGVIIVAYRSADDVCRLLDSLPDAAAGLTTWVVVVDNASGDDIATRLAGRSGTTLIDAGANLGYSGAINLARKHLGKARTTLVLNPDLRLLPDSVRYLYQAIHTTGAGAVVPRILELDGSFSPSLRREPTILRALGDGLLGAHWSRRPSWLTEIVWTPGTYETEGTTDWATGAVILVSEETDTVVGDWDADRFFLYSEETDYLRRVRDAGWEIRYIPNAVVEHRGGGSGSGPGLVALCAVNRVRYYRKYHGWLASAVFRGAVILEQIVRVSRPGNRRALCALVRPSPEGAAGLG